jgi:hypothetical protein
MNKINFKFHELTLLRMQKFEELYTLSKT